MRDNYRCVVIGCPDSLSLKSMEPADLQKYNLDPNSFRTTVTSSSLRPTGDLTQMILPRRRWDCLLFTYHIIFKSFDILQKNMLEASGLSSRASDASISYLISMVRKFIALEMDLRWTCRCIQCSTTSNCGSSMLQWALLYTFFSLPSDSLAGWYLQSLCIVSLPSSFLYSAAQSHYHVQIHRSLSPSS